MVKYIKIRFADNGLPIVYHEKYNLKALPYSMNRFQPMIPNKAEEVYFILKSVLLLQLLLQLVHAYACMHSIQ